MSKKALSAYPKISIVTPNYNYGHFLEETIQSVLNQGYSNLEYIVMDGGSTDNSLEIIKKYEKYLTYWVSEKDNGAYDAINKGFSRCSGDIMAYLNSDDIYLPWSFETVSEIFKELPSVSWISTRQPGYIDHQSKSRWFGSLPGFSKKYFLEGRYAGQYSKYNFIQQESTFWRKDLWVKAGGKIDLQYKLAGDFYLWNEFYKNAELFGVKNPLSLFRLNHRQKSSQIEAYISECSSILDLDKSRDVFKKDSYFRPLNNCFIQLNNKFFNYADNYESKIIQLKNGDNKNAIWEAVSKKFRY